MYLKDRIAVITGVSKGIGEALCRNLLSKGCKVYGLGRNNFDCQDENYVFIRTDVRSNAEVEKAFEYILTSHGGIVDILINNAGLGFFGNVEDLPVEQWETMMQTNVSGMFYCTRLAVPAMKKNGM